MVSRIKKDTLFKTRQRVSYANDVDIIARYSKELGKVTRKHVEKQVQLQITQGKSMLLRIGG